MAGKIPEKIENLERYLSDALATVTLIEAKAAVKLLRQKLKDMEDVALKLDLESFDRDLAASD